ncbi:MAG: hypothetical protein V2A73_10035, partial [Pseudomonadota bacterium]
VIIHEIFFERVNTYLEMLGGMLTNLLGGLFESERMVIWFEQCRAMDASLRQSMLMAMRSGGDISQNELRAEAGFPPDEDLNQAVIQPNTMQGVGQVIQFLSGGAIQRDQAIVMLESLGISTDVAGGIVGKAKKKKESGAEEKRSMLLNSIGGMTGTVQVLTAVGQGIIGREEAARMLALFLQVAYEEVLMMVPVPPPPPELPPPPETSPPGEEGKPEEGAVKGLAGELRLTNLLLAKALEEPERQAERILRSAECRC